MEMDKLDVTTHEQDDRQTVPGCRHLPGYPYRELVGNEVRLLRIVPGIERVECVLHQTQLTKDDEFYDSYEYFALSYVWGDTKEKCEIFIGGTSFWITKNLFVAMIHLRERYEPEQYYWMDAICLNQDDIEEKSTQIPRMMEIYHAASRVIIWLGPNQKSNNSKHKRVPWLDDPMNLIQREKLSLSTDRIVALLFEKAETFQREWEFPVDLGKGESVLRDVFGEQYPAVTEATSELLMRPWFRRVWTMQECTLEAASCVLAGRHEISLEQLLNFLKELIGRQRLLMFNPGFQRILTAFRLYKKFLENGPNWMRGGEQPDLDLGDSLLDILTQVASGEATDPRDQLYGILSLAQYFTKAELPSVLRPDYSLPFEVVYWNYATFLLQSTGDLRLLSFDHPLQGVPSWVTDFRDRAYLRGGHKGPVEFSNDNRTLYLQGMRMAPICDYVDEWYDPADSATGVPVGLHARIRYVEGRIFKPSSQIRSVSLDKVLDDVLWRVGEIFRLGGQKGMRRAYTDLRGHSSRYGTWVSKKTRFRTIDTTGKHHGIALGICKTQVMLEDGTILEVLRDGIEIATGDMVCIFKGANRPHLLRPSDHGNGLILVSTCTVISGTFRRQDLCEDFWDEKQLESFALV
ncbi:heterokaryon incompatibility protein-domain-containing protein [Xylariaceae sp. FL1019]|nr:heterokaryon incompatibility protein-domain-containing protein [Xylariaceae sp. FL1019]